MKKLSVLIVSLVMAIAFVISFNVSPAKAAVQEEKLDDIVFDLADAKAGYDCYEIEEDYEDFFIDGKSSNPRVAETDIDDDLKVIIVVNKVGKARITADTVDDDDEDNPKRYYYDVVVTKAYYNGLAKYQLKNADIDNVVYGDFKVDGETLPGTSVTMKVGKKTYKCKADSDGEFSKKIASCKHGTKVKITLKARGYTAKLTRKVVKDKRTKITNGDIAVGSRKIKGKVAYAHKGDVIKIKIGKKTYKKRITKNSKSYSYTIKLKKKKGLKFGKKYTVAVYNKYGQLIDKHKDYLYSGHNVKKKMTKKQVRWLIYWGSPDDINYTSNSETWWYDDDDDGYAVDSWIYFYKGRVVDWYY